MNNKINDRKGLSKGNEFKEVFIFIYLYIYIYHIQLLKVFY